MKSRAALGLVAAAALALAGCATGTLGGESAGDLHRRVVELERQALRQRLELERLERRLAEVERERVAAPRPAPSAASEPRPAPMPEPGLPPEPRAAPASAIEVDELPLAEPPAPATPPALAGTSLERYERALELYRTGRTTEAEAAFRALLAEGVTPDLGDNIWFWIGESRLGRGDAAGAIAAYRSAIESYPDGNKIPDALLKLGDALVELGDADAAQQVWRELVERFPATASSELARPRLEPR